MTPNRLILSCLAALLVALLSPSLAMAQPTEWPALEEPAPAAKSGSKDVVVLVAPEDYIYLDDIAGSEQNARDWEVFFKQSLGVPSSNVFKLTGSAAAVENIEAQVEAARAKTSPEGKLWFIFIGHGTTILDDEGASKGYLLGADTQQSLKSVARRGLATENLLQMLEAGKQEKTVVILDACFSGLDSKGKQLFEGGQLGLTEAAITARSERATILTASSATQFAGALPGARRPAFSYLLLAALRGWVNKGNGEAVTAGAALEYTSDVLDHLKDRKQEPTIEGDPELVLTRGAGDPGVDAIYLMENPPELEVINPYRPAKITLGAGSALTLASGGLLLGSFFVRQGADGARDRREITQVDYNNKIRTSNTLGVAGYATLTAGVTMLAVGGILWRGARKQEGEEGASLMLSPGGVGVSVVF